MNRLHFGLSVLLGVVLGPMAGGIIGLIIVLASWSDNPGPGGGPEMIFGIILGAVAGLFLGGLAGVALPLLNHKRREKQGLTSRSVE